jgi:hypothetical protein
MAPMNGSPRPAPLVSLSNSLGLSLVYASAYFLPLLTPTQAYFLKPSTPLQVTLLPTLVTVALGAALIWAAGLGFQKYASSKVAAGFGIALCSFFGVVALKGIAESAGYHWQDSIPRGHDMLATQRYFRDIVILIMFVLVIFQRKKLPRFLRLLGSLGFAFAALGCVRAMFFFIGHSPSMPTFSAAASSPAQITLSTDSAWAVAGDRPRRVVWVIFDETDFDRVFGPDKAQGLELPNWDHLAHIGVFATQANSPASATLYSIPALLTGIPISGKGIRIDPAGELALEGAGGRLTPLNENKSIFGVLREHGMTVSVLGFFHPYCQLFELQHCDRLIWPQPPGIREAMMANIPDSFSYRRQLSDQWSGVTRGIIELLPEYLSRDDALTFIHLNLPHLPASYADAQAHLVPSENPLVEYGRNLKLADRLLGEIIQCVQRETGHHELLLIVSSDHWLRNRWYRADEPEISRPVPLIMWTVGATQGITVTQPVSTIHTAEMILSYLQGDVSDQADIAAWWQHQSVVPSFIAPGT